MVRLGKTDSYLKYCRFRPEININEASSPWYEELG